MKKVSVGLWFVAAVFLFLLATQAALAGTSPSLELLSPKRGESIPFGTEAVIAISIYDAEGDADTGSVEFEVDGEDILTQANVSALLVTYSLGTEVEPGKHFFTFLIKDREGNVSEIDSFFTVTKKPEKEKKVTASGSVRAGAEYDKESEQNLIGSVDLNVFGNLTRSIDYSLNVELTNEESSDGQRISTYRLDLNSPFGGAVLGDATPSFTSYTIDGTEVFGVHLLPRVGFIGMELLYGQSLRDVEDPETFQQMVTGGRLKVGSEKKFLWGLTFLKVKDDKDSITAITVTPKDNIILGTDFVLSLLKKKVTIRAEANESLLNEDITGGAADFADYELPIDPKAFEWLFTINEHMVPIVPGLTNLAAKGAVKIGPFYDNTLNAEYSYVGPSYFSLANTAIVNDRTGIRAWDTLWLLKRKLFLSLAFQLYKNNLEDTLATTTTTVGFSGSAYVYPSDYLSLNAGVDVQTADDKAATDTMNTTINGGANYRLDIFGTNSTVYGTQTLSLFKDKAVPANDENEYSTRFGAISYFDAMPLDTKAVVGFDFGDVPSSLYLEGKGGYRFLKDESLYAFVNVIYESGPEQLDFKLGADFEAPWDVTIEADIEYITAPGGSDVLMSVFAEKEF